MLITTKQTCNWNVLSIAFRKAGTTMSNSSWKQSTRLIRLAQRTDNCTVLGPGRRAVLWVQGCPFTCQECIAPEKLAFDGGMQVSVDLLAEELLETDIEGVTFSGGEPMAQARALSMLIDKILGQRDMSFMSYSGFTFEQLARSGTVDQKSLLARLDILVDGLYIPELHTDLRWLGSSNQRVLFLTERHQHLSSTLDDRGVWVEFEVEKSGALQWMGIPPRGFRNQFEKGMNDQGIDLV